MLSKIVRSSAASALNLLPAKLSARLRVDLGRERDLYPFGFAMNGQTSRLEAVRQIIFSCKIKQIIETGTFRGTTSEWLAAFDISVLTIEYDEWNFYFAQHRLKCWPNVKVERGNSVEILRLRVPEMDASVPTMFYLDAHWENYLPLAEELALILPFFNETVIFIDDFQVPGDAGYGYDDYGPGKGLTSQYLRECLTSGTEVFYPSTPAEEETGRRRGWAVVGKGEQVIVALNGNPLLKHSPH